MNKLFLWSTLTSLCFAEDYFDRLKVYLDRKKNVRSELLPNYNHSFFNALRNYQVNAVPVSELQYPWIGRVIHSRNGEVPYMCTASCVDERIFITAARCIFNLKVGYTSVIYLNRQLPATAFVLPSNLTKEAFDDIGFIVIEKQAFVGDWAKIKLFNAVNRTDHKYKWFSDLKLTEPQDFRVVGYATRKGHFMLPTLDLEYELTELEVVVNMNLCNVISTFNHFIQDFYVPCYHSCTIEEHRSNNSKCKRYHGVLGGALVDVHTNQLFGIATWGAHFSQYGLPVGFTLPNSFNFFKDYACALSIKKDTGMLIRSGYYQSLCDEM